MARISLEGFDSLGTSSVHTATSWQVAKDPDFTQIIDQSMNDTKNLTSWVTPLPKLAEDTLEGETYPYYDNLKTLYARVKVHIDDTVSNWFVLGPKSQLVQKVIITQEDKDDIITDSHLPDKSNPDDKRVGWDTTIHSEQNAEFKKSYASQQEYDDLYDDPNILTPNVLKGDTV